MIENFGSNVKKFRLARGMTQKQLAEKVHIIPKSISEIERGVSYTSFETLDLLAEALDVTAADLFGSPAEQHIHSAGAILDRIDDYLPNLERVDRLTRRMEDFSPRQLDHLAEELEMIFKYFEPDVHYDEDGEPDPELDENGRIVTRPSRYRRLPVKKIDELYNKILVIKEYEKHEHS
ncbi:helix-turn-helix domain-containing protein [Lacticaseibacillus kribbianus]|uniref:helix-turn-helix domain-containing protein n=1 Tax=Lacticaseibacillus kribbianus TaxID=2926292 RepID=UPI001CD4473D|nr:helix-turn-helix transcriptional regulator [Lacticaseibacillus kribbianus]